MAGALERKRLAGGTVVLKMKTSDFRILTRNRRLVHPTQRADVLLEQAASLVEKEADGRTFRLIGVGVADLRPRRGSRSGRFVRGLRRQAGRD